MTARPETAPRPLPAAPDTERMHRIYRHLHSHPELSMREHATADFIAAELDDLGVENFRCGGTGVVGVIRNGQGPVVAFRADTDALPIAEDTGLDYASTATGTLDDGTVVPVMHGCGHDTHVTSLLTAARVLLEGSAAWAGTLVLVFQPGEETAAGARAMVDDGLWERAPRPEVVLGQHVMPLAAGTVTISHGTAMAMADALRVTLYGKQSHGSQPQSSIDPIVLGAHVITRLQTVVSRELDPRSPAVITSGTFHAGLKENIIPDRAEFTLNIRTFEQPVRETVLAAVRRIIAAEAAASNAPEPLVEEIYTFPRCHNDPAAAGRVEAALRAALGEENVAVGQPVMGSEDFGHLADSIGVPSVYWMFGGFDLDAGEPPVNHSPYFGPLMEPTLATGTRAAVAGILAYLGAGAAGPEHG
ncbi:amidohydrolase [Nocardiopsis dassonvillei]|uniref:amidohydrolase n=1 Tax=Nocardiopsis dassonvillei TaxID=2014 RepID=UPI00200DA660|nr:amidohydrolase [Nocardiopsis dassonvillei]MCK9868256.1 amidohydrolase [Nocardiopsis dassonvillei]